MSNKGNTKKPNPKLIPAISSSGKKDNSKLKTIFKKKSK